MKRRIILFLFPKRRDRVRCQQCWLLEECAAYLETGVTDYLPDEYPNHRIGRPKRNYPASLYRIFWAGPVAEASERQRHWENIYIGKAPRVRLKAGQSRASQLALLARAGHFSTPQEKTVAQFTQATVNNFDPQGS